MGRNELEDERKGPDLQLNHKRFWAMDKKCVYKKIQLKPKFMIT